MKIISWNVNGIRAILKKNFIDFIKKADPDILCLQEIKATSSQIQNAIRILSKDCPDVNKVLSSYRHYWHSAVRPGYSGVGILSKVAIEEPLQIIEGLGKAEFDSEGRVLTLEYQHFFLVTAYFPNSQEMLKRLDYKMAFNRHFDKHVYRLKQQKPVIACGDFNVAHTEIDLRNPQDNQMNPGFYIDERNWFSALLTNFIDIFRHFHPNEEEHYTWWSYRFQARQKNIGWRIDYFMVNQVLRSHISQASILKDVLGSDHCPIQITWQQNPNSR